MQDYCDTGLGLYDGGIGLMFCAGAGDDNCGGRIWAGGAGRSGSAGMRGM